MAKRQKTGKILALFDVDGTLTVPRKVSRRKHRLPTPTMESGSNGARAQRRDSNQMLRLLEEP